MRKFYLSLAVAAFCAAGSVDAQAVDMELIPADGSTLSMAEFSATNCNVGIHFSAPVTGNASTWTLTDADGETVATKKGTLYLGYGNQVWDLYFNGQVEETPSLDPGTYTMTIKKGAFTLPDGTKTNEIIWTFTISEGSTPDNPVEIIPADGSEYANPNEFNRLTDGIFRFYFGQNPTTIGSGTIYLYKENISVVSMTAADAKESLHTPADGWADYSLSLITMGAVNSGGTYRLEVPAGFFVINGTPAPAYSYTYIIGNPEPEPFAYTTDIKNNAYYEELPRYFDITCDDFQPLDVNVVISELVTPSFTQLSTGTTYNLESEKINWDSTGSRAIRVMLPEGTWEDGAYEIKIPKGCYSFTALGGQEMVNEAGLILVNVGKEPAVTGKYAIHSYPINEGKVKTFQDVVVYFDSVDMLDWQNWDPYKPVFKDAQGNELAYNPPATPTGEYEAFKWNGVYIQLQSEVIDPTTITLTIPAGFFVVNDVLTDEDFEFTWTVEGGVRQPDFTFSPNNEEMVRSLSEITLTVPGATEITIDQGKQATLTNTAVPTEEGGVETQVVPLEAYRSAVNTNIVTFEVPSNTQLVNGYWTLTIPSDMLNITMPAGEVANKEITLEYELRQFADVRLVFYPDPSEVQTEITSIIVAFPDAETASFSPESGWALFNADTMEDIPMDYENLTTGEFAGKATEFTPRKAITRAGNYGIRLYPDSFTVDGTIYGVNIEAVWTVSGDSSVDGIAAEQVEKVEYFDLTGVAVTNPEVGSVMIRRTILSDGEVRVEKVVVK